MEPEYAPIAAQSQTTPVPSTAPAYPDGASYRCKSNPDFEGCFSERCPEMIRDAFGTYNSFVFTAFGPNERKVLVGIDYFGRSDDELPRDLVQLFGRDPNILLGATQVLGQALTAAQDFLVSVPQLKRDTGLEQFRRIWVCNNGRFGMCSTGPGMRVNCTRGALSALIDDLSIGRLDRRDAVRSFLAAEFVHEGVHLYRDHMVGSLDVELPTHILQFAFDPRGNRYFADQLIDSCKSVATGSRKLYDIAQFGALLLSLAELGRECPKVMEKISADQSAFKVESLSTLANGLSDQEIVSLRTAAAPRLLSQEEPDLVKRAKHLCRQLSLPSPFPE